MSQSIPDLHALQAWLQPHLPELRAPLQAQRIEGGQSNPSWLLQSGTQRWVLRAKPGPAAALLPSAHAIEREFRVMQALQGSAVPVPAVRVLCDDESVLGAAFYVMDFVEGRVLRDVSLQALPQAQRAACYHEAVRVLAALHALDWRALGLGGFGRPEGYFPRLIRRWSEQYRRAGGPVLHAMAPLADWLADHVPADAEQAQHQVLSHGDFRLENLIFHPQRPQVLAVLDWELSTLGHRLGDLGYYGMAWHLPAGLLRGLHGLDLAALGLPSQYQMLQAYADAAGLALAPLLRDWPFHIAFNLFRLAAILHGIGARAQAGRAAHSNAARMGELAGSVAAIGWEVACGRRPAFEDSAAVAA